METGYFLDKQFVPSLMKLSASDSQRVMKAIDKYTKAPESPGLNLEQLEGRTGKRRLWTIRASQGLRVLLVRDGPTWVFLRAGHHDEIYDLAERRTFVVPVDGHPGLISIRPRPPDFSDSTPHRVAEPRQSPYDSKPTIVEHWTTGELARAEFSEDEIDRLRRATPDTLLEVWPMITDEKLDRVIECSEMSPDEWFARPLCRRDRRGVEAQAVSRCHRGARRTCGSIVAVVAAGAAAPDGGSDRRLDDLPPSRPACPCGTSLQWAGSCPGVRGYGQDGGRAPPGCGPGKAVHQLRRPRSEGAAVDTVHHLRQESDTGTPESVPPAPHLGRRSCRVRQCGQPGKSDLQTIRSTSPNRPRHREQKLRV